MSSKEPLNVYANHLQKHFWHLRGVQLRPIEHGDFHKRSLSHFSSSKASSMHSKIRGTVDMNATVALRKGACGGVSNARTGNSCRWRRFGRRSSELFLSVTSIVLSRWPCFLLRESALVSIISEGRGLRILLPARWLLFGRGFVLPTEKVPIGRPENADNYGLLEDEEEEDEEDVVELEEAAAVGVGGGEGAEGAGGAEGGAETLNKSALTHRIIITTKKMLISAGDCFVVHLHWEHLIHSLYQEHSKKLGAFPAPGAFGKFCVYKELLLLRKRSERDGYLRVLLVLMGTTRFCEIYV
eukprot:TRINITY_DN11962_c0_g1_i1.p1 TRINITY_DN11962_c0_g1~~TRINITY_DN11962_c0_g1_i1.p1  ORF type:complete len:298 (+),score=52.21 TRINITY_DN11962_c0_g1_i1:145-1038(+)